MKAKSKFVYICYLMLRWLVKVFYPKTTVEGTKKLPDEGCIIVGNHTQMNGPIVGELYFPGKRKIWCAWQMMSLKEVPSYSYKDFWSLKPKGIKWFYKLLSYLIAPIAVCIFNNANTIPVFHDSRIISTYRQTVSALAEGTKVIIFPECYEPHNHIINNFQDKFIDIAKMYYKRNGKAVSFVPMYIAPRLKKAYLGRPIAFCPDRPIEEERRRICDYLMEQITDIAQGLPEHKVVPYINTPSKNYKSNIPSKEANDEKAGC
ncbi:MAG: hypothetical protein IKT44_03715 [Clostridia bacterium]|nr:hypothetical protein [Clostridia bacterium]